eukprot:TRINITY_DN6287_c0_g1_i1.p1 TRINITY_DN6287_c0_g1~~TRINITY_DN6287_c0_g1_i1.p1  ORF type:complete len:626 (+),score=114.62 TRINITY_DN6287_c0_g1_i1:28-1878(+)
MQRSTKHQQVRPHHSEDSVHWDDDALEACLRDLFLRFPCAVLNGVRWSALYKALGDRYPGKPVPGLPEMEAARARLQDIAILEDSTESEGDLVLRLRDTAALTPGKDGQLACWPLLVQRLGEIVRAHGSPQPSHTLEVLREEDAPADEEEVDATAVAAPEVVGILLAKLKTFLHRYWDPGFEERGLGFFNEAGQFISFKKLKHFLAELLKWRLQRRALARHNAFASAAIDEALNVQLMLATSQKHNDMVLCCPVMSSSQYLQTSGPECSRQEIAAPPASKSKHLDGKVQANSEKSLSPQGHEPTSKPVTSMTSNRHEAQSPLSDAQQREIAEKENQRLRQENAELRERLQWSESVQNENRRLRVENAELKKRLFSSRYVQPNSPQATPVPYQPILVPMSMVATSPQVCESPAAAGAWGSGQVSPSRRSHGSGTPAQGSMTPIQQGFWVPIAGNVMSPNGQQWQPAAMGQLMAIAPGHFVRPATAAHDSSIPTASNMSPFSDTSHQARLLPNNLFTSEPNSHASQTGEVSSDLSPDYRNSAGMAPPFQGPDDRWVCIPSGIVERHKAQFEGPGAGDAGAEDHAAQQASEQAPNDTREEGNPQAESMHYGSSSSSSHG